MFRECILPEHSSERGVICWDYAFFYFIRLQIPDSVLHYTYPKLEYVQDHEQNPRQHPAPQASRNGNQACRQQFLPLQANLHAKRFENLVYHILMLKV